MTSSDGTTSRLALRRDFSIAATPTMATSDSLTSTAIGSFCGDSGAMFQYHESLATMLSKSGEALALFGQTTAGYFEVIRYKEGGEVERTLDPYTDADAYGRTRFKRADLHMDDPTPT